MGLISSIARGAGATAAMGLILTPLSAGAATVSRAKRTVPISIPLSYAPARGATWSPADDTARDHRWRRYRHHGNGVDGGDLLGGLLIIGGVAAVAAAIDKDKRQRQAEGGIYRGEERPYEYRGDERRDAYGRDADAAATRGEPGGDADRAVNACSAEAAKTGRVDEIFDVDNRDGEWTVKGDFADGREFDCTVDSSGRAYVGLGDHADAAEVVPPPTARNLPADDGRYATARSPDFEDPRGR